MANRRKLLTIDRCYHCHHSFRHGAHELRCGHPDSPPHEVMWRGDVVIPDWCPLPDAEEAQWRFAKDGDVPGRNMEVLVSVRCPDKGCDHFGMVYQASFFDGRFIWCNDRGSRCGFRDCCEIAWRPLPEPPTIQPSKDTECGADS